jgi:hypothetical protein
MTFSARSLGESRSSSRRAASSLELSPRAAVPFIGSARSEFPRTRKNRSGELETICKSSHSNTLPSRPRRARKAARKERAPKTQMAAKTSRQIRLVDVAARDQVQNLGHVAQVLAVGSLLRGALKYLRGGRKYLRCFPRRKLQLGEEAQAHVRNPQVVRWRAGAECARFERARPIVGQKPDGAAAQVLAVLVEERAPGFD